MPEDALEERLAAVERALSEAEDPSTTTQGDGLTGRVESLEADVAELEAAVQAVRGYVGGIKHVNDEVEQRADAAMAKALALERDLSGASPAEHDDDSRDVGAGDPENDHRDADGARADHDAVAAHVTDEGGDGAGPHPDERGGGAGPTPEEGCPRCGRTPAGGLPGRSAPDGGATGGAGIPHPGPDCPTDDGSRDAAADPGRSRAHRPPDRRPDAGGATGEDTIDGRRGDGSAAGGRRVGERLDAALPVDVDRDPPDEEGTGGWLDAAVRDRWLARLRGVL